MLRGQRNKILGCKSSRPTRIHRGLRTKERQGSDPEVGKQETIDRRVGKYELDTLLAIADTQDEFTALDLSKSGGSYAQIYQLRRASRQIPQAHIDRS